MSVPTHVSPTKLRDNFRLSLVLVPTLNVVGLN
jgi:hypothetical protein